MEKESAPLLARVLAIEALPVARERTARLPTDLGGRRDEGGREARPGSCGDGEWSIVVKLAVALCSEEGPARERGVETEGGMPGATSDSLNTPAAAEQLSEGLHLEVFSPSYRRQLREGRSFAARCLSAPPLGQNEEAPSYLDGATFLDCFLRTSSLQACAVASPRQRS